MSTRGGEISRTAVLGAGVMGTQIAALLANAGFDVDLLDLPAHGDPAGRARSALNRAGNERPPIFFIPDIGLRIRPGGLEDLSCLAEADWVIEAVVEDLSLKQSILSRVSEVISKTCVLSSNTSGLSIARLGAMLSPGVSARFLGIHFFNPVRQMKLVEVIPSSHTDSAVLARMTVFVEHSLGKRVVECRDTPNFIANRLGVFALMDVLHRMVSGALSVEEVDAVTGPLLGRPRSATLRLCDLIGLDTLVKVAGTAYDNLVGERQRDVFKPPAFVERMLDAGLLGVKSAGGFYRKAEAGIEVLDLGSLQYRPSTTPELGALTAAAATRDPRMRLQGAYKGAFNGPEDRFARFARDHLNAVLEYASEHADAMASELNHVDLAMKYGFNWELGPFEMIDAIGPATWAVGLMQEGMNVPPLVTQINQAGGYIYSAESSGSGRTAFSMARQVHEPVPPSGNDDELLETATVRWQNEAAYLFEVDGVGIVIFSSKMNVIGAVALEVIHRALDADFRALVVGGANGIFSAGADLSHMMALIQGGDWQGLEAYLDRFQQAVMGLRHAPIAVVAAPYGLALGGGCEICLMADRLVAAAELRMGLVETSVGLIPGAGGCVEMARRFGERKIGDPFGMNDAFELIFSGRFSDNALQARAWGLLDPGERIEMNADRILKSAVAVAGEMALDAYHPPESTPFSVAGDGALDVLLAKLEQRREAGQISAHDQRIGRLLAGVLCGGGGRETSTEQELLALEREAFLELCHTPATLERMSHMLNTGKPLRN